MDADETIEALKKVSLSRDIRTAHPELAKRFLELAASYKRMFPGRDLIVTCVYRSPDEQQRLYKQGRFGNSGPIVTNADGRTNKSKHNVFPARAIDCAVLEGGKAVWREEVYWPLGAIARECSLIWGGDWNGNGKRDESFIDYPHVELPKEVE